MSNLEDKWFAAKYTVVSRPALTWRSDEAGSITIGEGDRDHYQFAIHELEQFLEAVKKQRGEGQ